MRHILFLCGKKWVEGAWIEGGGGTGGVKGETFAKYK